MNYKKIFGELALAGAFAGLPFGALYLYHSNSVKKPTNFYQADIDDDGDFDIAVGNNNASIDTALNNGGVFESKESLLEKSVQSATAQKTNTQKAHDDEYKMRLQLIEDSIKTKKEKLERK